MAKYIYTKNLDELFSSDFHKLSPEQIEKTTSPTVLNGLKNDAMAFLAIPGDKDQNLLCSDDFIKKLVAFFGVYWRVGSTKENLEAMLTKNIGALLRNPGVRNYALAIYICEAVVKEYEECKC